MKDKQGKEVEAEYEGKAGGDPDGPSCAQCHAEIRRANSNFESYERVKFKLSQVANELKEARAERDAARTALLLQKIPGAEVWFWQSDGDDPGSLVCPVVMSADTLRALLAWRDCLPKCHAGGPCKKIGVKWVARHILYCDDHGGAWLQDAPWAELARAEGL